MTTDEAHGTTASMMDDNERTVGHGNLSGRMTQERLVEMQHQVLPNGDDLVATDAAIASASASASSITGDDGHWPSDASSYDILSKIGQGAFASVFLARCRPDAERSDGREEEAEEEEEEEGGGKNNDDDVCAIKILNLENVDANFMDIRLEVQTMRMSQHINILQCYTNFIRDTNLFLVMPFMNRGSSLRCLQMTRKHLRRKWRHEQQQRGSGTIPDNLRAPPDLCLEEHLTYILFETLKGLKYIHCNLHQIHRDIKAGNVLLDDSAQVKIADFGVSGWLVHGGSRREQTRTFVGTPAWMSPELMEQVEGYNHKTDIWSAGITALELAKGYAPYAKFPPIKVLLLTIQEDPPSLETYDDDDDDDDADGGDHGSGTETERWSKTFQDMIKQCLQKDPKNRPECDDLLNHPHFRHLMDEGTLEAAKIHTKEKVCDVVGDITTSSSAVATAAKKEEKNPLISEATDEAQSKANSTVRIVSNAVTEEDRPAGTTWVFSDGSQIMASSSKLDESLNEEEDKEGASLCCVCVFCLVSSLCWSSFDQMSFVSGYV